MLSTHYPVTSRSKGITAPQLVVLRRILASPSLVLVRLRGGFWTTPETPLIDRGVPVWSTTAQTVTSAERAGLIMRANAYDEAWRDNRRLTEAGEVAAREAPVPKLTPTMRKHLADFAAGRGFSFYAPDLETLDYVEKREGGWFVTAEGAAALARSWP